MRGGHTTPTSEEEQGGTLQHRGRDRSQTLTLGAEKSLRLAHVPFDSSHEGAADDSRAAIRLSLAPRRPAGRGGELNRLSRLSCYAV